MFHVEGKEFFFGFTFLVLKIPFLFLPIRTSFLMQTQMSISIAGIIFNKKINQTTSCIINSKISIHQNNLKITDFPAGASFEFFLEPVLNKVSLPRLGSFCNVDRSRNSATFFLVEKNYVIASRSHIDLNRKVSRQSIQIEV